MFLSHYDGREARPDGWTRFSEKSSGGENLLRCIKTYPQIDGQELSLIRP